MPASPAAATPTLRAAHCLLALGLAVVASACTGDPEDVAPSTTQGTATTTTIATRAEDGVLSIGIYLPRTGEGAQLGVPMIAAVQDAIDAINRTGGVLGNDIGVEIADEGAGTGPNQLLALGVDAIIGPASSTVALSQLRNVIDETNGVVTCSPTATALALDAYPDGGFFFRTVPSDSLQMRAIGRRVQRTGAETVAVAYLDDPYGRGLVDAFLDDIAGRPLELVAQEGFGLFGQDDLSDTAAALLADDPGVVVVLGDAGDGSRLLAALDAATDNPPQIIVNDSIRSAVSTIRDLSPGFRSNLTGVAPLARAQTADGPEGFFTAHAVDCVNLIALAAVTADSDVPNLIRRNMAAVSTGGRECTSFEACDVLIERGLQIDYDGLSGSVNLSSTTGDPESATFIAFGFDAAGAEVNTTRFDVGG